jgi:hypothetical protein
VADRDLEVGTTAARPPSAVAWAGIAILVPLILGLVSSIGTIDLSYHIRTGSEILENGSLPTVDTYTFSVQGVRWVDQQWGAQVVFHAVHELGQWEALLTLQGFLAAAAFGAVYHGARASGASARLASILTLAGFLLAYPTITLRPQLLALPLFGVALWVLAGRFSRPTLVWIIPVLAVITANVHGSFVLLPALTGLAWLDDLVQKRVEHRRMLLVTAATMAATLVNPYGVGAWGYALNLSTDPTIRESITEWAPLTLGTTVGAVTIGSALLIAGYLGRRTRPVPWMPMMTLAGFFLLALSASRGVLWWGMVAPVVVAGLLASDNTGRRIAGTPGAPTREARGPAIALLTGLVAAAIALLPWWRGVGPEQVEAAPLGVTRAVAQLPPGSRLFAHQPWGSWFIYSLPEMPVYVDSRIEIVPADVWEDYFQVAFAGARWQEALARWKPDAVVAHRDEWDLIPLLRSDSRWDVLYEDDEGVVFIPSNRPTS